MLRVLSGRKLGKIQKRYKMIQKVVILHLSPQFFIGNRNDSNEYRKDTATAFLKKIKIATSN